MAIKTVLYQAVLVLAVFASACSLTPTASGQTRTLRIVAYNIEADINGATMPLPGLIAPISNTNDYFSGGVLEGIGGQNVGSDPAQPIDVLALEETTSNPITIAPIVRGLNIFYNSPGMYTNSAYQARQSGSAASGNGPNAMVYNTRTLQLLASTPVDPPGGSPSSSSGELREVVRYQFAPAGVTPNSSNQFYVYVDHYKSSGNDSGSALLVDQAKRAGEAGIVRTNVMSLPDGSHMLFMGDFNTGDTSEPMYSILIQPGINQILDPLNTAGATNIIFDGNLPLLTDSATSLSYRDDYQMMTTNVYYGSDGGLTLVSGTYHPFGNNGTSTHPASSTAFNNIAAGFPITASQLYSYIGSASDHLPIVADYTIPAPPLPPAPIARFTAAITNGAAPLTVTFANTTFGATNYLWSFGDGQTSSQTNAANTYSSAGTYAVTLQAVNGGGTNSLTRTNYIVVTAPVNPLPAAGFTASPTNGVAPLTVNFTNTSTNGTNYVWTFGNGSTSALTNPTSIYTNVGTYSVTLTAVGAGGTNSVTRTNYIAVTAPPAMAFFGPLSIGGGTFQFAASNSDGTPITAGELSALKIYTAVDPTLALSNWTVLPDGGSLSNGLLQISDTNTAAFPQKFYRAVEGN